MQLLKLFICTLFFFATYTFAFADNDPQASIKFDLTIPPPEGVLKNEQTPALTAEQIKTLQSALSTVNTAQ